MNNKVDIGRFWDRVKVYACTVSRDADGAKVETYTEVATLSASVDADIDEQQTDCNVTDYVSIIVQTYRNSAITTRSMLEWNGRKFNVKSITPMSMISPFVTVTAEEVKL